MRSKWCDKNFENKNKNTRIRIKNESMNVTKIEI